MLQLTLPVATDGYLYPGPTKPLSIATSGYLSLVIIEEEPSPGGGGESGKGRRVVPQRSRLMTQLYQEDDEMLSIMMLATIYRMMD